MHPSTALVTRKYFLYPACKQGARLNRGSLCSRVTFGGLLARWWGGRRVNQWRLIGLVDLPRVGRLHGPSYNYRPQWHPWFSTWTRRGARAWWPVFQGPKSALLYATNLCVRAQCRDKISRWNNQPTNPLVKGMLIRFVTKNSVQVYAHLIRLQFVAIIEFVGIQSASLSTIYTDSWFTCFEFRYFYQSRVCRENFSSRWCIGLFFCIEFYFSIVICDIFQLLGSSHWERE